jgi:hypothetical protein
MRSVLTRRNGTRFGGTLIPTVAFLTAAALLCAPAAIAQDNQTQPTPGVSQQPSNIPDQKLDATAAAVKQVANIKETYQKQIESASPTDKERLATEANSALVTAITTQGLSVEEYTSILRVAQNDPGVREKILKRLDPATGK